VDELAKANDSYNRVLGTGIAWRLRHQSKGELLAGNRTQTGQTYTSLLKGEHAHVLSLSYESLALPSDSTLWLLEHRTMELTDPT